MFPKEKSYPNSTVDKSATTKNDKSECHHFSLPEWIACCQDEEPVFLRCGHQICVWVSKRHRCAGAGATEPWEKSWVVVFEVFAFVKRFPSKENYKTSLVIIETASCSVRNEGMKK